ncbi:MAG: ShlB/FhaC/HecB family hemolysin secretion/activation protein, partial [Steroidobacteraceae bacterium]
MVSKKFWGIMAISVLHSLPVSWSAETPAPAAPQPVKTFPILEYRVEGNTLLHAIDIERAVTPYLGEGRSIKDVEAARLSLEKIYHEHGYQTVLVNIPQQEVSSGVVRLSVVEAPVGQVDIKGSKYHSLEVIGATVPQLQSGVVPDFNEVQKELAQANHTQDLHVTPVLRASATPGQVDVDLDVQDQLPLHASLEVNNRYSANTAHVRVIGEVDYDNLFQSNQSISLQYQTAPDDPSNAKIWSASYVIPTSGGLVWALYAVGSDSNIAAIGATDVIGNGNIYGLRLIDPLPSESANFYHNFTAGYDYKDFKQNVGVQGADEIASPAKYALYTLQYTGTWLGAADAAHHAAAAISGVRSSTTLTLGFSFTVTALGFDDPGEFDHKRYGASPSFLVFHPDLQRQQLLPWNWSLVGDINGQLASGPLISNEQYAAGGVDSVRGYTEAERLGDNGGRASLELRTPQLLAGTAHITNSYLYLFADSAKVRILDPLPGQFTGFHLNSQGAGFRFKFGGLITDMDGARAANAGYVTRAGSYSAQFKV